MNRPGPKIDPDFAAQVLVDAAMLGDEASAKRHAISTKTVQRYRELSASDPNLSELVALKKRAAEAQWADGLAGAIHGQIDFLRRSSSQAIAGDPDAIHAVAGALKILADIALTSRMIDARLAHRTGAPGAPAGSPAGVDDDAPDGTVH